MTIEWYEHQIKTTRFVLQHERALVFNDPGTGKTASLLKAIEEHRKAGGGKALVISPKSIMTASWVEDCRTFAPGLSIAVASAGKRDRVRGNTDIVVINHDGVKALRPADLDGFDFLIADESTAFKNPQSQRSKAIVALKDRFTRRVAMTGTPMPNGLLDIWNQVYLVDDGERLGSKYWKFRSTTHEPEPIMPNVVKWVEKDGARDAVADLLSDITIRYRFEDCVSMPENVITSRKVELTRRLRKQYDQMRKDALLEFEKGMVSAINAGVLLTKLLQITSGAVYMADGSYKVLSSERYDLIAQLCVERPHTLVAFLWRHQREGIIKALEAAGISEYAVIDGSTRDTADIVERFQRGAYRVLLCHPASAGHGLTLTRATTTIWASPTYNAELFEQFNRRFYRIGQRERTETILIEASDTIEERAYQALLSKLGRQTDLLGILEGLKTEGEAYESSTYAT